MRNQLKTTMSLAAAMGTLGLLAAPLQAATVVGVTIEDFSSELGSLNRLAEHTIDGSGFNEVTGVHDTVTTNAWMVQGEYSSGTDTGPWDITFDLEGNYDLSSLKVWNWNEAGSITAGAKDMEILVASSVGGAFTPVATVALAQAPGNTSYFGEDFALTGADDVRLVKFNITSNHGYASSLMGLSEVRFDGVAAVPEPSSAALLGLGGLALILRRRK